MNRIVTIVGSPSPDSRTLALTRHVGGRLGGLGFAVDELNVRDLPVEDVLWARTSSAPVAEALARVERADALIIASPVYKAAYTGILKAFLDLLPQFGLAGKVVLPLVTGGTLAHVLVIDYALRPVLASLGSPHVTSGLFVLDKQIERKDGGAILDEAIAPRLEEVITDFVKAVRRAANG